MTDDIRTGENRPAATTVDEASDDSTTSNFRLYRWTCPYCEKSNLRMASSTDERSVVDAVVRHVRLADGDGHGPKHALSDDVEAAVLEHVTRVDAGE